MLTIRIQTNADFTPRGKRRARIVTCTGGIRQLRWYVGGKLFRRMPPNAECLNLTNEWVSAGN